MQTEASRAAALRSGRSQPKHGRLAGLAGHRYALLLLLAVGLALRLVAVGWVRTGEVAWGDTRNSAALGVTFALFGRPGDIAYPHAAILNEAMARRGTLVDPEDLGLRQVAAESFVPEYKEHIGLGLVMGALWRVTGSMRFIYVQLLQVLLDLACIGLLWYTARSLFRDHRIGFLGAGFYAVFPPQVYMSAIPFSYTWPVFLAVGVGALLAYAYGRHAPSGWRQRLLAFAAIGAVTGAVTYTRSTVLLLPLAIAVGILLVRRSWREPAAFLAVAFAAQLVVLSPLLIRNYREFDQVMVTRGGFWFTVWAGFGAHRNPFGAVNKDEVVVQQVLAAQPHISQDYIKKFGLGGPEFEKVLRTWSIEAVRERPLWLVRIQLERLLMIAWADLRQGVFTLPLVGLAVLGAALAWRSGALDGRRLLLFLMPPAYFFASVNAVYVPRFRYTAPGYVFLIVLAAAGLLLAYERWIATPSSAEAL